MSDILIERSAAILRVQLNRPAKKNAMTSSMYLELAEILNDAAGNDGVRVVLWHGAGGSFTAGNDVEDFLKNPPGPGLSPQSRLMASLMNLDKPLVAAVQGIAVGGGTTMLTHCDFVYAGESTRFQMPFVNLGLVPEFGSSFSIPNRIGYLRAAELILLGQPSTHGGQRSLDWLPGLCPMRICLPRRQKQPRSWRKSQSGHCGPARDWHGFQRANRLRRQSVVKTRSSLRGCACRKLRRLSPHSLRNVRRTLRR